MTPQVDPEVVERGAPEEPDELDDAPEFPSPTRDEWAVLVDGVLRKARRLAEDAPAGSGVDKLVREPLAGIPVRPLYTADDVPAADGTPSTSAFGEVNAMVRNRPAATSATTIARLLRVRMACSPLGPAGRAVPHPDATHRPARNGHEPGRVADLVAGRWSVSRVASGRDDHSE